MSSIQATSRDYRYREHPVSDGGTRANGNHLNTRPRTHQPKPSTNHFHSNGTKYTEPEDELKDFNFEYENLVLEGGGAQGNAYIGAILELDRLGFLGKIHRFAGASIGAFTACLLAMGHGADTFREILNGPQIDDLLDAPCGCCSFVPNVYRFLGWHPGHAIDKYIGKFVAEKFDGNADATFKDLYNLSERENKRWNLHGKNRRKRRELCVVITNVSTMAEEYCHVKTTPNMRLKDAVRMSTSIPGVFFPKKRKTIDGLTDVIVDGGLLCNYPVHCYDGWWLSMKDEHSFFAKMVGEGETESLEDITKRLTTKRDRFGDVRNEKTFGMIIYSDYDSHVLPIKPELVAPIAELPADTELVKAHRALKAMREEDAKKHETLRMAMVAFMRALQDSNCGDTSTITLGEFKQVFRKDSGFTAEHAKNLFGEYKTHKDIFDSIDVNGDKSIEFCELVAFSAKKGVNLLAQHVGTGRQDIHGAKDYAIGLFQTLLRNVKRAFLEGDDIERTVLINTVYYKSFDFDSEPEDLNFLVEQGRRGVRQFLKYHHRKSKMAAAAHSKKSSPAQVKKSPPIQEKMFPPTETRTYPLAAAEDLEGQSLVSWC